MIVVCSRCKAGVPVERFAIDRSKASGRKSWCKDCDNRRCKKYYDRKHGTHGAHRHCAYCGASSSGPRFCNSSCQDAHAWERRGNPIKVKDCAVCDRPFACLSHAATFCSTACRAVARREQDRKRDAKPARREYLNAKSRNIGARRRTVIRASDVTTAQIKDMLRARKCALCACYLTTGAGPRQKQVDHITPLAAGGTHTLDNLRVICRTCNLTRPHDGSDIAQQRLWTAA